MKLRDYTSKFSAQSLIKEQQQGDPAAALKNS